MQEDIVEGKMDDEDGNNIARFGPKEESTGTADSEGGSEGRSELLMYLTCPPERYRTAKFSLAAYVLCWALLKWYQVRFNERFNACLAPVHYNTTTLLSSVKELSGQLTLKSILFLSMS